MDGNNQPNSNGLFSHILDPHLGQVLHGLVRTLLPQHDPTMQPAEPASPASPQMTEPADVPPLEPAASAQQQSAQAESGVPSAHVASSSNIAQPAEEQAAAANHSTHTSPSPPPALHSADSSGQAHDVEMTSSVDDDRASSSADASTSRPQATSRYSSRRPRVDDEEDEDDLRESNRQRMNSPTTDDTHHHFMPIPDDHDVPQAARAANPPPSAGAGAPPNQPANGTQPHRLTWTFDFLRVPPGQHVHLGHPEHAHAQPAEGANPAHDHHHHGGNHEQLPAMNFFINIPLTGPGAPPQPGAPNAPGNAAPTFTFRPYFYPIPADGGNAPANGGFTFQPFPFPFGTFGMDMLEERDDPERAQRLVDGLEEVPVGLVKRMERVGGPGSVQGEAPTCAVCWESLLEPEGGGFEGNVELAKAEADEAAREDAASQQERESSMDVDSPTSASLGASSSSTSEASASTTPLTAPAGEEKYPKVVVLPCSHVFHASCLLPWFSKPGRTTCPSCRFDIDPDSLTYKPRPLRARRAAPPPAPQAGADAAQQPQQPRTFGPIHLPPFAPGHPQPAPHAAAQGAPNVPNVATGADAGVHPQDGAPTGQPGQPNLPLPPFISFDISMIIPIFPGRPAGAAQPAPGGQPADAAAGANAQGAAPQPPRTDHNGFRLDDPVLTEAVRTTFERIFGRPAPGPRPQPQQQPAADGAAPADNANAPPREPPMDWFTFAGPLAGFPPMPPPNAPAPGEQGPAPQRPAPKRKWTLPPPPGPTLRQLVERNEREMGLRCSDVSCGLGPSDDDPISTFDTTALRQISIRPLKDDGSGKTAVCEHKFHPSCLVSAERVAGWGGEDKKEERENDAGEDVEVSCPVCRAVGVISRLDWEEGACALA